MRQTVAQTIVEADEQSNMLDYLRREILSTFAANPIPVLFKEKAAAYLGRFCAVSYPLIYHSCGLYSLGMAPRDIVLLLQSPSPTPALLAEQCDQLARHTAPLDDPTITYRLLEEGILICMAGIYLDEHAEPCGKALFRLLGPVQYEHIRDLITYARTFHRWAESHRESIDQAEVLIRDQIVGLLEEENRLVDTFLHYRASPAPKPPAASDVLQAALGVPSRRVTAPPPPAWHPDDSIPGAARAAFEVDDTLRAVIYASPLAITTIDMAGAIRGWNPAAERLFGWTEQEVLGRVNPIVPSDRVDEFRAICRRVRAGEALVAEQVRREKRDGTPLDIALSVAPLYGDDGGVWGLLAILEDITERKRLADGMQFLDQVSTVLSSSLDYHTTLSRVARLAVPGLADWCFIYLRDPDGSIRRLAAEHADPAMRDLVQSLPNQVTHPADSIRPVQLALQTGQSQLVPEITEDTLPETVTDSRIQQMTRALGMRSYISVPLRTRGQILGVISLITAESRRRYSEIDLPLAEELAHRVAVAIDHARIYGALADREQQYEELVARLLVTQEEERRRFAYDVHDGIAQVAASAYQHLQTFARFYNPNSNEGQEALGRALSLAQRTVREARDLVSHLRPTALEEFGLGTAICVQSEELSAQGWRVTYTNGIGNERLPAPVETALYRITQEALTNIQKHAAATEVEITLERLPHSVRLCVRDWGKGFAAESAPVATAGGQHVGLPGIRERAKLLGGECTIESKPGQGTRVLVEIPISGSAPSVGVLIR
jgi:PAS domain S-box-containing protein